MVTEGVGPVVYEYQRMTEYINEYIIPFSFRDARISDNTLIECRTW